MQCFTHLAGENRKFRKLCQTLFCLFACLFLALLLLLLLLLFCFCSFIFWKNQKWAKSGSLSPSLISCCMTSLTVQCFLFLLVSDSICDGYQGTGFLPAGPEENFLSAPGLLPVDLRLVTPPGVDKSEDIWLPFGMGPLYNPDVPEWDVSDEGELEADERGSLVGKLLRR